MNIIDLLIGKKVKIMTDMKVEVELTIKEIKDTSWTRQITPDTRENDWWGESERVSRFEVMFENGASKTYDSLQQIKIEE